MDSLKKWFGVVAAVISASSGIYGVLKFQGEQREHSRIVEERLMAGRMEQGAKDYAGAWASYQEAAKASTGEGLLVSLFGGLSVVQQKVRTAQEDLAMEWLRNKAVVPQYSEDFAATADQVLDYLTAEAAGAEGARKADLLAHVGWAHFGKKVSGVRHQADLNDVSLEDAVFFYRQAVAADPTNPYANAFWGASLVEGPYGYDDKRVAEAGTHFAAALSTPRERDTVRKFELVSLGKYCCAASQAWWAAVYDVLKAGESIEPYRNQILSRYESYFNGQLDGTNKADAEAAMGKVPPAGHVAIVRSLLKEAAPSPTYVVPAQMALAVNLEASGKSDEALAVWRAIKTSGVTLDKVYSERVDAEIQRLGAAAGKT